MTVDNPVTEAFKAGRIYVEIDPPRPLGGRAAAFVGDRVVDVHEPVRIVHVMSKPAGGEIRGYVLTVADGQLRLRLPCYTGRWDEMDAEVLARVPGARAVTAYDVDHAGVVRHA